MDVAQKLIRMYVRAFHPEEVRHILVIDALCRHSALFVEDLAHVLGMNVKDLRKLCQPLKERHLIRSQLRPEMRPGHQRPTNKEYYFINFHSAINAIKYTIMVIQKTAKEQFNPTQERKDYICSRCKREWTQMDVLPYVDMSTGDFLCPECKNVLERPERSAEDHAGSARMSQINDMLKPFVVLLQDIDGTEVPENTFDDAISRHVPIERSDLNPAVEWRVVSNPNADNTVRGERIEAPRVQVSLTSEEETRRQTEETKRKHAEQQTANLLPEWYTNSTITGERTTLGEREAARLKAIQDSLGSGKSNADEETKPAAEEDNEHVKAYYEELRRAQEKEARESSGEDEEEDDDDGFEDVPVNGTPASSIAGTKRKADDDDDDDEED